MTISRISALALVVLAWLCASARAGGFSLESNAGPRDKAVGALLRPVFDELGKLGYRSGREQLGAPIEASHSRPSRVGAGLPADFSTRVDEGYRRWIRGDFPGGLEALRPLVALARDNAADLVGSSKLGAALFKAQVGIAMCHHRLGDAAESRATLEELVRSYDAEVTKGQYGSEAYGLYQDAKKALRAAPTGSLAVAVRDPATVVFVNERFVAAGGARADLAPGTYRVMGQLGPHFGRVYTVEIKPGASAELRVAPELERTLVTGPDWVGLAFADEAERASQEVEHGAAVGGALGEAAVVLVGTARRKGKVVAYASLVNATTGREVRRAGMSLETLPPAAKLRALARFVVEGGDAPDGVEVLALAKPRPAPTSAAAVEAPPRKLWSTKRKIAVGVLGLGVAAAVTGVVFGQQAEQFEEDARTLCPVPGSGCVNSDRAEALLADGVTRSRYSIASFVLSGVAVLGAGALWIWGAPPRDPGATAWLLPRVEAARGSVFAGLELRARF